jgi:predicted phage terminase large subunit-like protein
MIEIRPQPGPQEKFLSSPADIVIYGGAAGGGKTWALLLECLRYIDNPRFFAVIFRRTFPQIRNPGGLWDASMELFPLVGGTPRTTALEWIFPSGSKVVFRHLKQESDRLAWQGTELPLICFDEMTHFTEPQFWYLLSRNRSTCGVRPYIRCTTNPDSDSWVRPLIDHWLNDQGFPNDQAGEVRHFIRESGELRWCDQDTPYAKSLSFVPASLADNQILMRADPGYLANLRSLPLVERQRLLDGNWNIKPVAGKVFRAEWFPVLEQCPATKQVRFWDFAASVQKSVGSDPDWTVGAKLGLSPSGVVVLDVVRFRGTPAEVDRAIAATASQDGIQCAVRWFEDPGQAGIYQSNQLRQKLRGYDCAGVRSQLDKYTRAKPFSRAAEFGEVSMLRGAWNGEFLNELSQFPDAAHDDQVDAVSGAYLEITGEGVQRFRSTQYRG